ncbi:MAG: hypothetical protein AAGH76_05885 [Pseudomonadota bacterium]
MPPYRSFSLTVAGLALAGALRAGEPVATDEINDLLQRYNTAPTATLQLPLPDDDQLTRLKDGEIISYRNRVATTPDAPLVYQVVALATVPEDRLRLWVATLGSVEQNASRLVEVKLRQEPAGAALWYQFVNLPWPVADRHWVIRSQARAEIAAATETWWEHGWALADGGQSMARKRLVAGDLADLSERQFDKAVYLPANTGGWLMARLSSGHTFVAVHATAELGGGLPKNWVARYVSKQLNRQVEKIRERSIRAESILATSAVIFTGRGEPVTRAMLERGASDCARLNQC